MATYILNNIPIGNAFSKTIWSLNGMEYRLPSRLFGYKYRVEIHLGSLPFNIKSINFTDSSSFCCSFQVMIHIDPLVLLTLPALSLITIHAHSWLDCTNLQPPGACAYIRGQVLRTPRNGPTSVRPRSRALRFTPHSIRTQSGRRLTVSYTEDGHATKDSHPTPETFLRRDVGPQNCLGQLKYFDDGVCAEDNTKRRDGPKPRLSSYVIPPFRFLHRPCC